jgi:hypothetical protein
MRLIQRVHGRRNLDWRRPVAAIDTDCHLCHSDQGEPCKQWGPKRLRKEFHDRRANKLKVFTVLWHGTTRSGAVKLLRTSHAGDLHLAEDWQRAEEYADRRGQEREEQPFLLMIGVPKGLTPDPWAAQECADAGIEGHAGQWLLSKGFYQVLRVVRWDDASEDWQELPLPRENWASALEVEL